MVTKKDAQFEKYCRGTYIYRIGNGNSIMSCLDPWWNHSCIGTSLFKILLSLTFHLIFLLGQVRLLEQVHGCYHNQPVTSLLQRLIPGLSLFLLPNFNLDNNLPFDEMALLRLKLLTSGIEFGIHGGFSLVEQSLCQVWVIQLRSSLVIMLGADYTLYQDCMLLELLPPLFVTYVQGEHKRIIIYSCIVSFIGGFLISCQGK